MASHQQQPDMLPHLIDIPTVMEHLAITPRHVRRLVAQRQMPFHKVGHLVRFDPLEVAGWLDERRVRPLGWAGADTGGAGVRLAAKGRSDVRHPLPFLIDLPTVARHLGVTDRHVRRLISERRIPFLRVGRLIRFDPEDVAAWLNGARASEPRSA
jgi:excisionase family DNA binding protein